jgi:hypothetical protein
MEFQKAKRLNNYLSQWMATCVEVFNATKYGESEFEEMDKVKAQFQLVDFEQLYKDFIAELEENIEKYRNIDYMDKYLEGSFYMFYEGSEGYQKNTDGEIIKNGYEVKFLLNVKKTIDLYYDKVKTICFSYDDKCSYSPELRRIFTEKMKQLDPDFILKIEDEEPERTEDNPFDFEFLQAELVYLATNQEKLDLINQRIIDFEQWKIKNNLIDNDSFWGSINPGRAEFAKLCRIEMKRYPVEKEEVKKDPPIQLSVPKPYKWAMNDTDFLELFTALYQNECIERKDGKTFSRKELIDYFQGVFGLDIKDVEGKLTRATNRNDKTPFLDDLSNAFEIYAQQKEKKLLKRR